MDGLRTRALPGENAGRGTYAVDHVAAGAGRLGVVVVSETGRHPF